MQVYRVKCNNLYGNTCVKAVAVTTDQSGDAVVVVRALHGGPWTTAGGRETNMTTVRPEDLRGFQSAVAGGE